MASGGLSFPSQFLHGSQGSGGSKHQRVAAPIVIILRALQSRVSGVMLFRTGPKRVGEVHLGAGEEQCMMDGVETLLPALGEEGRGSP